MLAKLKETIVVCKK